MKIIWDQQILENNEGLSSEDYLGSTNPRKHRCTKYSEDYLGSTNPRKRLFCRAYNT